MNLQPLLVLNVVGLSKSLLGEYTPNLMAVMNSGTSYSIQNAFPAVTCSVQSTYITGEKPETHGVVGNGWLYRETQEVRFWQQANTLVSGEKIWEKVKSLDPTATCANLFWWFNMHSTVDYSITVRPMYPADGRKIPDIYTQPSEWRDNLNDRLGSFPLFKFWGPLANIESSQWIEKATLLTLAEKNPTLTLVYLPHLDYCLQKYGPASAEVKTELLAIDALCGNLIKAAKASGRNVVVLSEYSIEAVDQPVHINRLLRSQGWVTLRTELDRELLDVGASQAFAVADHQIAHVYIKDPELISQVKTFLETQDGIDEVWNIDKQKEEGVYHARSGELLITSKSGAWFTYYYWLDDRKSPDYARTVDIHRKPGYDPAELFIDPTLSFPKFKLVKTLLKKKLGFRTLMDVIPLDAQLVKGSHGRCENRQHYSPVLISDTANSKEEANSGQLDALEVCEFLLNLMTIK